MRANPWLSLLRAEVTPPAILFAQWIDVDLDADPFAQCEQDTLDRRPVREYPMLDEEEAE
jgi:hypothetical protein